MFYWQGYYTPLNLSSQLRRRLFHENNVCISPEIHDNKRQPNSGRDRIQKMKSHWKLSQPFLRYISSLSCSCSCLHVIIILIFRRKLASFTLSQGKYCLPGSSWLFLSSVPRSQRNSPGENSDLSIMGNVRHLFKHLEPGRKSHIVWISARDPKFGAWKANLRKSHPYWWPVPLCELEKTPHPSPRLTAATCWKKLF